MGLVLWPCVWVVTAVPWLRDAAKTVLPGGGGVLEEPRCSGLSGKQPERTPSSSWLELRQGGRGGAACSRGALRLGGPCKGVYLALTLQTFR